MKPGTNVIEAAKSVGHRDPVLLLPQAALHRGQLPHVPGGDVERPGGQAHARLPDAGRRGHRRQDRHAAREGPAARRPRVPAAQPPGRLLHLRPGRRVQAAGLLHEVRPPAVAPRRAEGREGQARPLGPPVVLDQERCILCTRCVRFMREVAKEPQLGVAERGNESLHHHLPRPAARLPSTPATWSTSARWARSPRRDFRFRGRVWFLSAARSVCTGCARGCNIFLDYLNDDTYRYRPRENDAGQPGVDVRRRARSPTSP